MRNIITRLYYDYLWAIFWHVGGLLFPYRYLFMDDEKESLKMVGFSHDPNAFDRMKEKA